MSSRTAGEGGARATGTSRWGLCAFAHLLVVLVHVAVGELLPAQFAFVGFVLAVDDLVGRHLVQALEGAATDLAGVRSLLCRGARNKKKNGFELGGPLQGDAFEAPPPHRSA